MHKALGSKQNTISIQARFARSYSLLPRVREAQDHTDEVGKTRIKSRKRVSGAQILGTQTLRDAQFL